MYIQDWKNEPDLDRLRDLYAKLENNPFQALPGLKELAEQGSLASALYLADYFMNQASPPNKNEDQAKYWYAKAHQYGYPQASYMLGRLYYEENQYQLAFEAFSKGAEKGYAPAIYRLAKLYQNGEGIN